MHLFSFINKNLGRGIVIKLQSSKMCYYYYLFIYFCYLQEFCGKASVCGHYCRGIKDEETCLPCLSCPYDNAKQTANDICAICYTDALPAIPSIQVRFSFSFSFVVVIDLNNNNYWH